ncbi:MAG: hypothetical protein H6704_12595 [Myxococcales bacterium]|nr:hypothetical protein [Myxococcales bacterium]
MGKKGSKPKVKRSNERVAAAVVRTREKLGVPQHELAERLGWEPMRLAWLEKGMDKWGKKELADVRRALGVKELMAADDDDDEAAEAPRGEVLDEAQVASYLDRIEEHVDSGDVLGAVIALLTEIRERRAEAVDEEDDED